MKQLILFITLFSFIEFQGAILIVDNSPGSGAPYTSLTSASNAAAPGDTLMIQPSAIYYGNFTLNKHLVLIGPGHFLEQGKNATIGTLSVTTGSSNSIITGLRMTSINGAIFAKVNNLTISRNYIEGGTFVVGTYGSNSESNDWVVEGNVMVESSNCGGCTLINPRASISTNWVLRNNILITRVSNTNTRLFSDLNATTTVYHNIIIHRNPGYIFGGTVGSWGNTSNDVLLQNNIFWVQNNNVDYLTNCSNCQYVHNLSYSPNGQIDTLPGSTNLSNVDPQFVNIPAPNNAAFTYENDYRCAPGSPGATAASDGGMVGVYGGGYRFSNNGDPVGIPKIIEMILENVVIEEGNNASVRVKAVGGQP